MPAESLVGLVGLVGAVGGGCVTLLVARWQLPKIRAEARKLEAEASRTEWQTLRDEINRLTEQVRSQGQTIASLQSAASSSTATKRENDRLKKRVRNLEQWCDRVESILRIGPISAKVQVELDKLNEIRSKH